MELDGRLPQTVRPRLYTLTLRVHPEAGRFYGRVIIDVTLEKPVAALTLHALTLSIQRAQVHQKGEVILADAETNPDETILLKPAQNLAPGFAQLDITYAGHMNKQLRGLYEADHQGRKFVFTQFEATDARRMLPCFDEPGMKAKFSLTVTYPADLKAVSNMPILEEREEQNGEKTTLFETTPVMSTYLLALALAPFECKTTSIGRTQVSVWALPDQLGLSEFALNVTANVLPRLNAYFDLPYPYPKLDLVAAPNFAMGAMENWGAIFFRDSCLLLSEPFASTSTKRDVANVITHEIVHQWFGNLVTMKWWDDLWLNESFATWLAVKIVDQWMPEWNSWTEFQQEKEIPLFIDALKNTRPIRADVQSAAQIEEMFDALTYEKGAACLRMIETFLGEDTFREGIRNYIKAFQYQNASAGDLWTALADVSGQPVGEIARDWFARPGFPLVSLRRDPDSATRLILEQSRYPYAGGEQTAPVGRCGTTDVGTSTATSGSRGPGVAVGTTEHVVFGNTTGVGASTATSGSRGLGVAVPQWSIPFTFKYQDSRGIHYDRLLLSDRVTSVDLSEPVTFIYGNADEGGFFRVDYDLLLRDQLEAVLPEVLNPAERIGYLGHTWALTFSGKLPLDRFLSTLCRFRGDKTRVVVEAIVQYLEILHTYIVMPEDIPLFQAWVHDLLMPVWEEVGWDPAPDENDEIRLTRAAALWGLGALAEEEDILSEIPRRKTRYDTVPTSLDPTLVTPLLRLCARFDRGSLFDPFVKKYQNAETPEERDRYLTALADFNKTTLAIKLLTMTLTPTIRSQEAWKPVRCLLRHKAVCGESWEFVKAHWNALRDKTGSVGATRMISATKALWTPEWKEDVERFFNIPSNKVEAAQRTLAQTVEQIEMGTAFKAENRVRLSTWLRGPQAE